MGGGGGFPRLRPAMSTGPGRGGLLAAIRSRFTALYRGQPCDCGRSAGTHRQASPAYARHR
jgi:hypothetical protein